MTVCASGHRRRGWPATARFAVSDVADAGLGPGVFDDEFAGAPTTAAGPLGTELVQQPQRASRPRDPPLHRQPRNLPRPRRHRPPRRAVLAEQTDEWAEGPSTTPPLGLDRSPRPERAPHDHPAHCIAGQANSGSRYIFTRYASLVALYSDMRHTFSAGLATLLTPPRSGFAYFP